MVAMDVIADFEFGRAVDSLPAAAAVADKLAGGFEDEAEEAGAGGVTDDLASDPFVDFGGGEGVRVPAHGFLVAEDGVEGGSVVRGHFAEDEARGFEHRVQVTGCGLRGGVGR